MGKWHFPACTGRTHNLKNATPNLKRGMLIFEDVLGIERNSILQLSQMRRLDPEHKWGLNRLTVQHMRGAEKIIT